MILVIVVRERAYGVKGKKKQNGWMEKEKGMLFSPCGILGKSLKDLHLSQEAREFEYSPFLYCTGEV